MDHLDQNRTPEVPKSPGILLFFSLLIRLLPGWIDYLFGRYKAGVASSSRVIAWYPNADALNNRGLCYLKLEDWTAAYADFDQALALHPGHAMILNNRGYTAYKLGRYDEALIDLDQSLARRPNHRRALINRVLVYLEVQREEEALRDCNRLLAMKQTVPDLMRRGAAYAQLGRYDEALADYTHVLVLKPKFPYAVYNMACARSLQGEIGTALTLLRQAIDDDPNCRDKARMDPDLIPLRREPEFRALVGDSHEA